MGYNFQKTLQVRYHIGLITYLYIYISLSIALCEDWSNSATPKLFPEKHEEKNIKYWKTGLANFIIML